MSKKKEKSIAQEVEEELARLSPEEASGSDGSKSVKSFFEEMLRQQAVQNASILKSMHDTSHSMVAAVKEAVAKKPAPPVIDGSLYDPGAPNPLDTIEDASSEEEADFEGWDFAPSGKVADTVIPESHDIAAASSSSQINLDDDLFQAYSQMPNWNPAQEILMWLRAICNKEVPPTVSKEIF